MDLAIVLQRPIPDQAIARERHEHFHIHPLMLDTPAQLEPMVALDSYGVAAQSYYSRPNNVTGEALADVPVTVYVRQTIAERLAEINRTLRHPVVTELLGGPVELYVNEGFRSQAVQKLLYNEAFPALIKRQHPQWSATEIKCRRDQLISPPSVKSSPAPHSTGAAIDVRLRYLEADQGYRPAAFVNMGYDSAETGKPADLDYFETKPKLLAKDAGAQRNRRVFYWLMRGAVQGKDSGFVANPYEWWHWSYGDQLWAALTEAPAAFYAAGQPDQLKQPLVNDYSPDIFR